MRNPELATRGTVEAHQTQHIYRLQDTESDAWLQMDSAHIVEVTQ